MRIRFLAALALAGCAAQTKSRHPEPPAPAILLDGLSGYHRPVSTTSVEAQRWFDQGLALSYGFNAKEAVRSFQEAAAVDPSCAMAFWGIAYASGPDINSPAIPPEQAAKAWEALQEARRLQPAASPVERALIEAMASRWSSDPAADRKLLDRAFADAMRKVFAAFPRDADVAAIFAGALMQLHPWRQWHADGKPEPEIPEVLAALEASIAVDAKHPLANHLSIHALEASPHPERADAAAEVLRSLQPGAGHLLHMPSHIDVRTGRWARAVEANQRAIEADLRYLARVGFERGNLPYQLHDHHTLAYAAMMSGRSALALAAVRAGLELFPAKRRLAHSAGYDAFTAMLDEVRMRFGHWDEILAAEDPDSALPYARAIHFAARAIALAARGDVAASRAERVRFEAARIKIPASWEFKGTKGSALLEIAARLVEGEVLLRAGQADEAIAALRAAAAAEDAIGYSEPPPWIQPVRHALGAALLKSGRGAEAEAVFREDLAKLPDNGWSLFGLAKALRLQHREPDAADAEARFARAWREADVQLESPCFCQGER